MTLYEHPLTPAGSTSAAEGDTGRLFQMITGYWVTQVVRTAADVARAESLDPSATFRFLRACVAVDLAVCPDGEQFTAAMTDGVAEHLADVISLTGGETVVDVGGAAGAFVQTLLARHPGLRGVCLDLPRVADAAGESAGRAGVADRFEFVGGDFFDAVPRGDVHLLKYVLHDWDDESAARLLRSCRDSLNPGGRILVAQLVIDPDDVGGLPPLMDLNMLTLSNGGRERSRPEFEAVFEAAGLRLTGITPSASLVSVLEAVPA